MKMNSLGYISNSSYNVEMINKQCNAGGPLETPGRLIQRNVNLCQFNQKKMCRRLGLWMAGC